MNRTVEKVSHDVVIIRCSANDASRVINALHGHAKTFWNEGKDMKLGRPSQLCRTVAEEMNAFAFDVADALGTRRPPELGS